MKNLVIKKGRWNKEVEKRLAPACDQFLNVAELEELISEGTMSLFSVSQDGDEICNFVLRLDGEEDLKEMVVVTAGGHLRGASLFNVCTPYIEELARQCNASFIRGHVDSMAKAKLMEKAGYNFQEFVYRKEVSDGRKFQ